MLKLVTISLDDFTKVVCCCTHVQEKWEPGLVSEVELRLEVLPLHCRRAELQAIIVETAFACNPSHNKETFSALNFSILSHAVQGHKQHSLP